MDNDFKSLVFLIFMQLYSSENIDVYINNMTHKVTSFNSEAKSLTSFINLSELLMYSCLYRFNMRNT